MRILFAGDERPYSAFALRKVIDLAINTWADLSFLAVHEENAVHNLQIPHPQVYDHPLCVAMHRYREEFLQVINDETSPYAMSRWSYEWFPLRDGAWEELKVCRGNKKELKVRLRIGNPASEILAEARARESDLIILGCTKGHSCCWHEPEDTPRKVINDAECSVLLVKENQPVKRVLACIDHMRSSQESLEMINQIVTIHNARLELIGLTNKGDAKPEVYSRLIEMGDYFEDRGIPVKTGLTDISEFETFLGRETGDDLLAFSMGKKSLMSLFFPRNWVGRFVSTCQTSVLVLR